MPLPAPTTSAYPDLDALLRAAKDTLANADSFEQSWRADMAAPVPEAPAPVPALTRFLHGAAKLPQSIYEGVRATGDTAARHIREGEYHEAFRDVTQPLLDPLNRGGSVFDPAALFTQAPESRDTAVNRGAEAVGVPLASLKGSIAGGDYAGAAGEASANALLMLALHKIGKGMSEPPGRTLPTFDTRPPVRIPDTNLGDSTAALQRALRMADAPANRPPAPEAYDARPISPVANAGSEPQGFAAPKDRTIGVDPPNLHRIFGTERGVYDPTPRDPSVPYHFDNAGPYEPATGVAEGYDPYMPNTSAAPEPVSTPPVSPTPPPAVQDTAPFTHVEQPPVPEQTVGKPRVSAQEFADILAGREKYATQYADAEALPGARDELDRSGLEYRRTQSALKQLLHMPDADPVETGRMQRGARELGSMLRQRSKLLTPPPEPPSAPTSLEGMLQSAISAQEAEKAAASSPASVPPGREGHFSLPKTNVSDEVFNQIREQKGIPPTPLERVDRPIEPMMGNDAPPVRSTDPRDPMVYDEAGTADLAALASLLRIPVGAAIGAGADSEDRKRGAMVGGALGAASFALPSGKILPALEKLQGAAMLSRPATTARVIGANLGGGLIRSGEKAFTEGSFSPLTRFLREASNVPQMARDAVSEFKRPGDVSRFDTTFPQNGLASLPGRVIGAADAGPRMAMERSGFTPEEARRVTMQVEPETPILKDLVGFQRKHPLARLAYPFVRTGANLVEQGLVEPGQALGRVFTGTASRADVAKLLSVGALSGTAYAESDNVPLWAKPFLAAASGPYAVPTTLANIVGTMVDKGKNPAQTYDSTMKQLAYQVPFAEGVDVSRGALERRAVPGIVSDAAALTDSTPRDTSSFWGPLLARIPGLSRLLPPKAKPHAATGNVESDTNRLYDLGNSFYR